MMAERPFEHPKSISAAERDARHATAVLFARVAAHRRRARLVARFTSCETIVDLLVAMTTYTGVTVALIIVAIYGVEAAVGLLTG